MKIDFSQNKELRESISELIKKKLSSILEELNSLEHLDDFVKIIIICLSSKFEGTEEKMREEFVDIFEKREDLTDNFIAWLKKEVPRHLERSRKADDQPKPSEAPKEPKSILDRVKMPDRGKKAASGRNKDEGRKPNSGRHERKKRNREDFEDGISDSDEYNFDHRSGDLKCANSRADQAGQGTRRQVREVREAGSVRPVQPQRPVRAIRPVRQV